MHLSARLYRRKCSRCLTKLAIMCFSENTWVYIGWGKLHKVTTRHLWKTITASVEQQTNRQFWVFITGKICLLAIFRRRYFGGKALWRVIGSGSLFRRLGFNYWRLLYIILNFKPLSSSLLDSLCVLITSNALACILNHNNLIKAALEGTLPRD